VQELSVKLIAAAKANKLDEFGQHLIYRGDDENKQWKTALNINDPVEKEQAADMMKRVNRNIESCDNFKDGKMQTEKESEGTWIIWKMECDKKIVSLAYLRIKGKLLLGDTDVETKE
jgi:hypothetical protein